MKYLLLVAILLAGCDSKVKYNDGRPINIVTQDGLICAYVYLNTGGGLSCDWANYQPEIDEEAAL